MLKELVPQGSVHLSTGVAGLNEMIAGGYQQHTVTAIIGESGTGRTTMALQYLVDGMLNGETVLYVSLTHDPGRLRKKLAEMYPGIESVLASKLHAFKLDPKNFDALSYYLGNALPELVTELGVTRMVIDPLTLYEDTLISRGDQFSIMSIHQVYWTLKTLPCTSIVVLASNTNNPLQSSNGHSEKFADNVIFLFRDYPEKKLSQTLPENSAGDEDPVQRSRSRRQTHQPRQPGYHQPATATSGVKTFHGDPIR